MKLQHLAIIFVIIILPISLVVGEYIQTQINTIALQTAYSSKLQTATYDAINAFRLNTVNNKYSSVSDSKIRDINASISTFYTSLGREIEADGYGENELQVYTPALLYTMYDGYYIYSKYYNEAAGEYQYGLKPYIYYTCRYKKGDIDIVVNYTLDNYITIYGYVGSNFITKSGNIIDPDKISNIKYLNGEIESINYCDVKIEKEVVTEQLVYLNDNRQPVRDGKEYSYIVYDNNKVYYDGVGENGENRFFTINSEFKKQYIIDSTIKNDLSRKIKNGVLVNDSAVKYYDEAYRFSKWVKQYLSKITQKDAVDENGNTITDFAVNTGDLSIFNYKEFNENGDSSITDSTFDLNRISVIRKSIKTNLLTAIANYNHLSGNTSYQFVLPVFSEEDWYKITNNISVVSFLQGIPIGTKYFNDYCVITNNKNKEVVTINSLYAITEDGEVHLPNCKEILDNKQKVVKVYKNIDFERQNVVISEGNERYYYPHYNTRCYDCLVNVAETYDIDYLEGTVKDYDYKIDAYILKTNVDSDTLYILRREVLTALARERYDLYKVNDYFKGYDETIGTDSVPDTNEDSKRNILVERVFWNENTHLATAIFRKADGVADTLKIQYQINPIDRTLSDNSAWTAEGTYENETKVSISNRKVGDVIYLRLFDGTYDGDYMRYTIVDTVPPDATVIEVAEGTRGNNNYYTSNTVRVRIIAGADRQSGVSRLEYSLEGANSTNGTQIAPSNYNENPNGYILDIVNDGLTVIRARTIDNGGQSSEAILYLYKDSQAPQEPTVEISGTMGQNSYYTSNVTVKFGYGKDPGEVGVASGIEALHYEIKRPNGTVEYYTAEDGEEITNISDGTTIIRAYMQDNAGNKSAVVEKTIRKDTQNPVIVANLSASDITTRSFRLNISVRDATSGIDKIIWYYKKSNASTYTRIETLCNGETTTIAKSQLIENLTSGVYNTYVEIFDKSGRMTQTGILNVTTKNIDRVPTLIASPSGIWTNGNVIVYTSDATNNYLRETGYALEYQIGSYTGAWQKYNGAITITSNTTVYYRYTDGINAGNYGTININNIDKIPPGVTTIRYNSGYSGAEWQSNINITLSASDTGGSGVSYYEIDWNGDGVADTTTGANFIPWNGWNSNNNRFRAVDGAGNRGPWSNSVYIAMNTTTYTITLNLVGGNASWTSTTYNASSEDITLPTPTRGGYTFKGWTGSNGGTPQTTVTITKGSTGDKSYTANWEAATVNVLASNNVSYWTSTGWSLDDSDDTYDRQSVHIASVGVSTAMQNNFNTYFDVEDEDYDHFRQFPNTISADKSGQISTAGFNKLTIKLGSLLWSGWNDRNVTSEQSFAIYNQDGICIYNKTCGEIERTYTHYVCSDESEDEDPRSWWGAAPENKNNLVYWDNYNNTFYRQYGFIPDASNYNHMKRLADIYGLHTSLYSAYKEGNWTIGFYVYDEIPLVYNGKPVTSISILVKNATDHRVGGNNGLSIDMVQLDI